MAELRASVSDVKARFSEWIHRVSLRHERVVVVSHGTPKAVLVGIGDLPLLRSGGLGKRRVDEVRGEMQKLRAHQAWMRRHAVRGAMTDSARVLRELREERASGINRLR